MRIGYLVLVFLVISFLITACSNVETPTGQAIKEPVKEAEPETTPAQQIQEPEEEKPSCTDECSSDSCDGYKFISCETTEEGCKSEVNNGFIKGKCNVECISDSDCKINERCSIEFSCIEKESTQPLDEITEEEPKSTEPLEEKEPIEQKLFTVSRVIDGDTIEIQTGERVRLICIDTPEVGEYYYQEAKDYLINLILNEKVKLVKDVSETDRYSRLLRYVYVEDVFVNGELIEKGYARVYRYPPDTKLCDYLEILEIEAKNNNFGIWLEVEEEETTDLGYICSYNVYNCGDFSTHAQAQAVYEGCGGVSNDVHRLDRDEDGLACESLP